MAARLLRVMALIVCTGCRCPDGDSAAQVRSQAHQAADSSAPPADRDDATRRRRSSVERADQALREHYPLDYRRPFRAEEYDDPLPALYAEACRDGDKRSCWIRAALDGWGSNIAMEIGAIVVANCRAGDLLSCRALPQPEETDFSPADVPGATGRSSACQAREDPACDVEALNQECSMGFPYSCAAMQDKTGKNRAQGDAYYARALMLAREGCRMDIATECRLLKRSRDDDDRMLGGNRRCALESSECVFASVVYQGKGDLIHARDLHERACQYATTTKYCAYRLGKDYMRGLYEEPVAGRGEALISWACKDDYVQRRQPDCKEWAATHATPSTSQH